MKKLWILLGIILLLSLNSYSQSLRSIRHRVGNAMIDKVIDDEINDSDTENADQNTSSTDESSNRPANQGGSGLDNSLDDVPTALAQASTEFNAEEYRNARTSLRKALRTLEIKIGEQLLVSLPENVKGLPVETDADKVVSSTKTWAGLTIHREYKKDDSWASISIYNGTTSGLATTAIRSGMYSSYEEDENQKQVQIKGNDAVITYSDSDGYAISITLGQQTFVAIEGVNIASEAEMIAIAECFDYEKIKKTLGDQ